MQFNQEGKRALMDNIQRSLNECTIAPDLDVGAQTSMVVALDIATSGNDKFTIFLFMKTLLQQALNNRQLLLVDLLRNLLLRSQSKLRYGLDLYILP